MDDKVDRDDQTQARQRAVAGQRLRWRLEGGYNAEELREIFRLTDWMMPLPKDLNRKFAEELVAWEESLNMPYITSVERIAEARGEARGRAEGEAKGSVIILLKQLARVCGPLPAEIEQRVRQLPVDRLETLAEAVVFEIRSLEDARVWLETDEERPR